MKTVREIRTAKGETRMGGEAGSVLIIVLWVAFGLVSVTLYFAHSMAMEMRAADNRSAALEAEQAIAGALRYVTNLLANAEYPGQLPDVWTYQVENVPVGTATFWLIGRGDAQDAPDRAVFGLVDEASKLNLNTATLEMLEALPGMTAELAAAIVDWRDTDAEPTDGGAEDEVYLRLDPAYRCKNGPFESVEELRLVSGAYLDLLFGEDTNLNGVLDANENDGDASPPSDNRDGRLDPGLFEYLTVYTRESATRSDGTARIELSGNSTQELATLLQEKFGTDRANQILRGVGNATNGFPSVVEFYLRSGMTADEFAQIESDVMVSGANGGAGLVNVNTASEAVLACIPGIGPENAPTLVAQRQGNTQTLTSVAWITQVLAETNAIAAGPYLTGRGYQFSADLAAVGHHGRGYQRVRFVCDTRDGTPRIIARRDLTPLGWALGREVRENLQLAERTR